MGFKLIILFCFSLSCHSVVCNHTYLLVGNALKHGDVMMWYFFSSQTWDSSRVDHVTLVSIAAGEKDIQVARHLTLPKVNSGHGQILTYLVFLCVCVCVIVVCSVLCVYITRVV